MYVRSRKKFLRVGRRIVKSKIFSDFSVRFARLILELIPKWFNL